MEVSGAANVAPAKVHNNIPGGNNTVNMFIEPKHVYSSIPSFQYNIESVPTFSSSHHLAFHISTNVDLYSF